MSALLPIYRVSASAADRTGLETPPPVSGPDLAPFPGFPCSLGNGALSSPAARFGASGDTGARPHPDAQPLAPVHLSEAEHFVLRLIAIHDRTSERDVLGRLIVERAKQIGLSPLLGKHFEDSS